MIKVNLTTFEATRESLPQFLQGLKPESLQDLSWTDAQLGVSSFGYWDENDVTPTLTATQLHDGTETLTVDAVAKVVNVTRGVRAKTADELFTEHKEAIQHFTQLTTNFIESKIRTYNETNGVAFTNIDAFAKYVSIPTSVYNGIAIQFITYADNIWTAVRAYQLTLTTIPTDAEFQVVLDSVVF